MENATKALLIAAAVLVAILIISLGLVVYNMAAETVQNVNIDDTEVQAHNEKFTRYLGDSKRGKDVNALLAQALNHNVTQEDDAKKITIKVDSADRLTTGQTSSATKVDTGKTYKVVDVRDPKTGLITEIDITTIN